MASYLSLVNDAIEESGLDLTQLDSTTFSSTTDSMHRRMKRWVNRAWNDIQLERNSWKFKQKRATIIVSPRVYVEQNPASAGPSIVAGEVLTCLESGFSATITAVELISGDWADGNAEAYLSYISDNGIPFKFNEYASTVADASIVQIKGWGRYNLQNIVTDLLEFDDLSFSVQSTGASPNQPDTADMDLRKMWVIPWAQFNLYYEGNPRLTGQPMYLTTTPDGSIDFYPRPEKDYVVHFNYSATPSTMVAYDDTPQGLASYYHEAIMWRAVWYYGKYEQNAAVERRAYQEWMRYKKLMEHNKAPNMSFAPSRYRSQVQG